MVDIQAYALKDEVFVSTTGQSRSTIGTKSIFKPFYTNIEKTVFSSLGRVYMYLAWGV